MEQAGDGGVAGGCVGVAFFLGFCFLLLMDDWVYYRFPADGGAFALRQSVGRQEILLDAATIHR